MTNVYTKLSQTILEAADGEEMKIKVNVEDYVVIGTRTVGFQTPMITIYELDKVPVEKIEYVVDNLGSFLELVKKESKKRKEEKAENKTKREAFEKKLTEKLS